MNLSRRHFISATGQFTAGAAILSSLGFASAADHGLGIALSQYSLRALLKDGALDALDFPQYTVDNFGITAIDLWEGGLPADKLDDTAYLDKMKQRAEKAGTELFLLMAGALTTAQNERQKSLQTILPSLDRAARLECEFVRIFLKASGSDVDQAVDDCVESLKPLADAAAAKGLIIAIEPGASPLSQQGAFLARVMQTLQHPACKLMPDFGKLKDNVYDGTAAMLPYTVTVSAKMHSFDEDGNQPDFDYHRLIKMIVDSGYRGYLAIEWEGQRLSPIEGVKASQKLIHRAIAAL